MKLKNEQEIKTLSKKSWDEWKSEDDFELDGDYYQDGYANGYTQAQQDLLSQASEGYESTKYFTGFEAWQASSLSHAKKMHEKNAEVERLKGALESINENLMLMLASYGDSTRIENLIKDSLKIIKGEEK